MARRRWFYSRRGAEHGPFKGREIAAMVESGEILGSDLLWKKGGRPRPAARYRKLFRRRPTVRTRNWILAATGIAAIALLLALLLSPGGEWAEMAPEHLRGFCLVASIALTVIAVAALGVCAIAIDTTFVDAPNVRVRRPRPEPAREPEPAATPHRVGVDASLWAAPQALSWGLAAAKEFAAGRPHAPQRAWPATLDRRKVAAVALGLVGVVIAIAAWSRGPFRYRPVAGTVAYADGSLIPITEFQLVFHPLARPPGAATDPPTGVARVDGATGSFTEATSAGRWSGIVAGPHKVTLHAADGSALADHLVNRAYSDPSTTLLMIDTAIQPVSLRLEKP